MDRERREDVRSSLDLDTQELRLALRELERVTRAKLDMRQHLVDHQVAVLLAGFVLGFWWAVRPSHQRPLVLITTPPRC